VTIASTKALTIPRGTTGQRPSNPVEGMIRYNTDEQCIETYEPLLELWVPISIFVGVLATGGDEDDILVNGIQYRVHTFTTSGQFNVLRGGNAEYLIVAGGGSGGTRSTANFGAGGGGGGAGGVIMGTFGLTKTPYDNVIGVGGASQTLDLSLGIQGGNSSALGLIAIGGGAGGRYGGNGGNGGSGGGGGRQANTIGGIGFAGPPRQGFNGGSGGINPVGTGGGGGAGENGAIGTSLGGVGGKGISNSITGNSVIYGGGGGGASFNGQLPNNGGVGGGGRGGTENPVVLPLPGLNGLGGGGGGGNNPSGAGGSGIVIIQYRIG